MLATQATFLRMSILATSPHGVFHSTLGLGPPLPLAHPPAGSLSSEPASLDLLWLQTPASLPINP